MNEDIFNRFFNDLSEILTEESENRSFKTRKVLNEEVDEDWVKAGEYYEQIKSDSEDVHKICRNLNETHRVVTRVKDYLFVREHIIISNDVEEKRCFDPDPEIVNAWSRLTVGDFVDSDKKLFKHEQVESILVKREGMDYQSAHLETIRRGYDWKPEEAYNGDPGKS
ncbi:hypothetical protein [Pantoea dispersa]|uniref:hypothetical protein n=1 Tax=Pantoea dispersa TaxID=59814 RepID=UPI001EE6A015|nr:hypothetical protein [Pantoea dispersa]UKY36464.1 hypothetical protein KFZ74_19675 [Pantoea dispersa]